MPKKENEMGPQLRKSENQVLSLRLKSLIFTVLTGISFYGSISPVRAESSGNRGAVIAGAPTLFRPDALSTIVDRIPTETPDYPTIQTNATVTPDTQPATSTNPNLVVDKGSFIANKEKAPMDPKLQLAQLTNATLSAAEAQAIQGLLPNAPKNPNDYALTSTNFDVFKPDTGSAFDSLKADYVAQFAAFQKDYPAAKMNAVLAIHTDPQTKLTSVSFGITFPEGNQFNPNFTVPKGTLFVLDQEAANQAGKWRYLEPTDTTSVESIKFVTPGDAFDTALTSAGLAVANANGGTAGSWVEITQDSTGRMTDFLNPVNSTKIVDTGAAATATQVAVNQNQQVVTPVPEMMQVVEAKLAVGARIEGSNFISADGKTYPINWIRAHQLASPERDPKLPGVAVFNVIVTQPPELITPTPVVTVTVDGKSTTTEVGIFRMIVYLNPENPAVPIEFIGGETINVSKDGGTNWTGNPAFSYFLPTGNQYASFHEGDEMELRIFVGKDDNTPITSTELFTYIDPNIKSHLILALVKEYSVATDQQARELLKASQNHEAVANPVPMFCYSFMTNVKK